MYTAIPEKSGMAFFIATFGQIHHIEFVPVRGLASTCFASGGLQKSSIQRAQTANKEEATERPM
jgi:hypothetical protein